MAGTDIGAPRQAQHAGGRHKTKRRLNVRIDMTPMVDVVMLLITFFMLTTVFNTPQTMEINSPASEAAVEVAESNLLTLRVTAGGNIAWNMGVEQPQPLPFGQLRPLLEQKLGANSNLVTLVKVQRESSYASMVDVMDELNLANITRFSLAPFHDSDAELLRAAGLL